MSNNQNYQKLQVFFQTKFPDANETILRLIVEKRLKGLSPEEIDSQTSQELINFFRTVSPEELQSLSYNAIGAKI